MKLRMFGATDKGLVRAQNQDAYTCNASRGFAVLSDGMGGHAAGEVASHMVVEGLSEALTSFGQYSIEDIPLKLDDTIQQVNTKLILRSQDDSGCRGMGATVNVLFFAQGFLTIGHVGDSRTYLIRAFKSPENKPRFGIWPLTIDHNLGTFIDRGILSTPKQSSESDLSERDRSKLTRGMGVMADPKPDIYSRRIAEGDIFLTCSDGLHGFVTDKDMLRAIATGNLIEAPQRLIDLAKAAGAPDNVTVVLSVVSNLEEPFRDFEGPVYNSRPYLLRLPNGEIQGPLTVSEITDLWVRRAIPGNTEVAASLGPWLLLRNKSALLHTYKDFDSEPFSNYIYYESSVTSDVEGAALASSQPVEVGSKSKRSAGILIVGLIAALALVSSALWFLLAPELAHVLLPAY